MLDAEELRRKQHETVERVRNVLSVGEDVAHALLKHCNWCETWLRRTCVCKEWTWC